MNEENANQISCSTLKIINRIFDQLDSRNKKSQSVHDRRWLIRSSDFSRLSSRDSTQLITLGTQSARLTDANRSILSSYSSYLNDTIIYSLALALPVMAISLRAFTFKSHLCPAIYPFIPAPANLFVISLSEMDILAMEIINFLI